MINSEARLSRAPKKAAGQAALSASCARCSDLLRLELLKEEHKPTDFVIPDQFIDTSQILGRGLTQTNTAQNRRQAESQNPSSRIHAVHLPGRVVLLFAERQLIMPADQAWACRRYRRTASGTEKHA